MERIIALMVCLAVLFSLFGAMPVVAAEKQVTVLLNGSPVTFDVPPMLMNGRTMVPMRAIFEALGAKVNWSEFNESVSGISKTGKKIVISIGSNRATVDGVPVEIDAPPVLVDGRTLVPLRFISESFDCEVGWDDATYTVTIQDNQPAVSDTTYFYTPSHFRELGVWILEGETGLRGRTDGVGDVPAESAPAILTADIAVEGQYKLWAYAKDFETNNPGARFFHASIDGVISDVKLGAHGKEGFAWQEVGTYNLTKGKHDICLLDTSGFYARCYGLILSRDLSYVPTDSEEEYGQYYAINTSEDGIVPSQYPAWAKAEMTDIAKTETIENEKIKMVFYEGTVPRGRFVQNEIFLKVGNEWRLVKAKSEDLGVLAMRANEAPIKYDTPAVSLTEIPKLAYETNYDGFYGEISTKVNQSFYKSGKPEWLIPTFMQKDGDKIVLGMSSENVDATLTYSFDELSFEPKVTFNATMKKEGAYSFAYFTGDEFKDDEFDRVTAPVTYVKDFIPEEDCVLGEYLMFTPMVTFTFGEGNNAITKGLVVDPTEVRQDVATPGRMDFGVMFRSPNGLARGQLVAPVFNSEGSLFNAGDSYAFSYRLLYNNEDAYANYVHVAEDLYKCNDIRSNYYHSINEAIYNTTDLLMDDMYGGWDDKSMGFYYMEHEHHITQSNIIEMMQRYMLTENEAILEERAIPSLAYLLTRGGKHFGRTMTFSTYFPDPPAPLKGVDEYNSAATFVGLYRMSQGRTPFFLNYAAQKSEIDTELWSIAGLNAMNNLQPDDRYVASIIEKADKYIAETMDNPDSSFNNRPYVDGFVAGDSNAMLNAFLQAYEATGEQKYLDAAEDAAQYSMYTLWTTGYQNDYATSDYTVDPVKTVERPLVNDGFGWYYHKDGIRWRVGNPFGVVTLAKDSETKLKEETAPGWVPARTGMTTEHIMTPANGNAIYMNMWPGSMLRIYKYTGDEFFLTQARNAIVGRFGNYPGYYNERYLLHDKQADYPYKGPDFNLIYWHHIPVFLGMLEDFLINNIWLRSDANIEFPTVLQTGYAYFTTNQYGFAPGKFYDEDGMWLWLDRGIIEPDSVAVDYITAKKDGVLGLAMVNENDTALTTTITLGEKIPNHETYTETATFYDKDGNKSTVEIVNGKFTVTIPARGIQSVVLHPDVKTPAFARDYTVSNTMGDTCKTFNGGKAYLLQFNDENYYAYIYTTKRPQNTKSVTFDYTIDGKKESVVIDEYPFETIIKVPADQDIQFKVTATGLDGKTTVVTENVLSPLSDDEIKPYVYGTYEEEEITSSLPQFKAFDINVSAIGLSDAKTFRLVVPTEELLKNIGIKTLNEGEMLGAKVQAVLHMKAGDGTALLENTIISNEVRDNGTTVLIVTPTKNAPAEIYHDIKTSTTAKIIPASGKFEDYKVEEGNASGDSNTPDVSKLPDFKPFAVTYRGQGCSGTALRFLTPFFDYPFDLSENLLKGLKLTMVMTENKTGESKVYECIIEKNEMRDDTTVLQIQAPEGLKAADYVTTHTFKLTISKPDQNVDVEIPDPESVKDKVVAVPDTFKAFTVRPTGVGASKYLRAVCNLSEFPFEVAAGTLDGLKIKVEFSHGGKKYSIDSVVVSNEARGTDQTVLNIDSPELLEMFPDSAAQSSFRPDIIFMDK
ncbi:MAG: hypothetical protein IJE10_10940 [Clostridia bacterium]|nr:hypothetical protein [Clostridia bacterium]